MSKKLIALVLSVLLMLSLVACAVASASSVDLMKGIKANEVIIDVDLNGRGSVAVTDFAVSLFQKSMKKGENSLISPVSVLYALAMAANGAVGEARTQMEDVLGMPVGELNEYLHTWMKSLSVEGKKYKLTLANAIWFKDVESFTVNQDFLQANADYYGAGIYKAPFDQRTCNDINNWVREHTDHMIDGIIHEIPSDTVMYLVNALAFDAEWKAIYKERAVREGIFTAESGAEQQVEFMYGDLYEYLEDELATGFVKEYAEGSYIFVAMLPNEGVSVVEYVESLTGEHLQELLAEPQRIKVHTSLPKFETEFSVELSDALKSMGMETPFLKGMEGVGTSTEDIYMAISKVLHKTFIAVDEKGTKAGAVTAVSMIPSSGGPSDYKEVYLDRPFVYMIVDPINNVPIFIGSFMGAN